MIQIFKPKKTKAAMDQVLSDFKFICIFFMNVSLPFLYTLFSWQDVGINDIHTTEVKIPHAVVL